MYYTSANVQPLALPTTDEESLCIGHTRLFIGTCGMTFDEKTAPSFLKMKYALKSICATHKQNVCPRIQ